MTILFKKLTATAIIPKRATKWSACVDLHADCSAVILPGKRALIKTGLAVSIYPWQAGRIWPRSGLALRGIDIAAGVIDSDYRGELGVILVNNGEEVFTVNPGDRIAQFAVITVDHSNPKQVDELDKTDRGENGFGHSGI